MAAVRARGENDDGRGGTFRIGGSASGDPLVFLGGPRRLSGACGRSRVRAAGEGTQGADENGPCRRAADAGAVPQRRAGGSEWLA